MRKVSDDNAAVGVRTTAKQKIGSEGDHPGQRNPTPQEPIPPWRCGAACPSTEAEGAEWNVPCMEGGCGSSQGAWNCISTMMLKCAIAAVFDLPTEQDEVSFLYSVHKIGTKNSSWLFFSCTMTAFPSRFRKTGCNRNHFIQKSITNPSNVFIIVSFK